VAWAIGVLGRNQRYARVGDVIKVHIKDAAPDAQVKKGVEWGLECWSDVVKEAINMALKS
jgi:ribosomal protein L14